MYFVRLESTILYILVIQKRNWKKNLSQALAVLIHMTMTNCYAASFRQYVLLLTYLVAELSIQTLHTDSLTGGLSSPHCDSIHQAWPCHWCYIVAMWLTLQHAEYGNMGSEWQTDRIYLPLRCCFRTSWPNYCKFGDPKLLPVCHTRAAITSYFGGSQYRISLSREGPVASCCVGNKQIKDFT